MQYLIHNMDFGNEAGDDVAPDELRHFFFEQTAFRKLYDTKKRLQIVHARKGVGKSALINWLAERLRNADTDALVIKLRGSDITRAALGYTKELSTPQDRIHDWMARLCTIVNREVGRRIKWAGDDDSILLVEAAEVGGYKQRNIVSALTDRFSKLLGKYSADKLLVKNEIALMKRRDETQVWLLIDDLDATFQKQPSEIIDLSTFFSACRYLFQDVPGINIRVTLRTDVWPIIRRSDESLDKIDQYLMELAWSEDDFRSLLAKRIRWQISELKAKIPEPTYEYSPSMKEEYWISKVFCEVMNWGEYQKKTYKILYTLSYSRPRWGIQLAKLSQVPAKKENSDLIEKRHLDEVWGDYGRRRIDDLIVEHRHQCSMVEDIIYSFRGAERKMSRDQLLSWIKNHVTNLMTPVVDGKAVKDPLVVAHFLYRMGFVLARKDTEDGKAHDHYFYHEMPDFLSAVSRRDFGVQWEIHPCYREALDIQKFGKAMRRRKADS